MWRIRMRTLASWRLFVLGAIVASLSLGGPTLAHGATDLPVDTELSLVSLAGEPVPGEITITATFGRDGQLTGNAGCNRYGTSWEARGSALRLGPVMSARMACPEPAMSLEAQYLALLSGATGWSWDGTQLVVASVGGEQLVYQAATDDGRGDIIGLTWTLADIDGSAIPEGVEATLVLEEDGTAGGSGGCNSYSTDFRISPESISFGAIASTEMMCEPPRSDVEAAFLAALGKASTWALRGGRLTLADVNGGNVLGFDAPADSAAKGAWSLVTLDGQPLPSDVKVTLQVDADGSLGGHGGCNQYGGPWSVEGEELSIGPLRSTLMACLEPAGAVETAYLGALEGATSWTVVDGELRIAGEGAGELVFRALEDGTEGWTGRSSMARGQSGAGEARGSGTGRTRISTS
jgi:heat shock protein HslJ